MTSALFWINDDPDDPIALLGPTNDVLSSFFERVIFDDPMLRLYEGDEFWY
jgi:hypothetical protein